MNETTEELQEIRRSRMIAVQMIVVGIVLLVFGLIAFFLSSGAEGTYAGKWRYVCTLGLAGVGLVYFILGLVRKARAEGR